MSGWKNMFYLRALSTGYQYWDGAVWQGDPLQCAFFRSWSAASDEWQTARHKPNQIGDVPESSTICNMSLPD